MEENGISQNPTSVSRKIRVLSLMQNRLLWIIYEKCHYWKATQIVTTFGEITRKSTLVIIQRED